MFLFHIADNFRIT